jgi:TRAP-type C4-dicarboxylate transport system permease small subunit
MTRKLLDALYQGALYGAAIFIVLLLAMVLAGVVGRLVGFHLRGSDAYAGYSMAAAAFLALAHTLKKGEHIRVTLLTQRLSDRAAFIFETGCYVVGLFFSAALAFYSTRLSWQSLVFNDISHSMDETPLWIPQIGMVVGTCIFFIAVADELYLHLRYRKRDRSAELDDIQGVS